MDFGSLRFARRAFWRIGLLDRTYARFGRRMLLSFSVDVHPNAKRTPLSVVRIYGGLPPDVRSINSTTLLYELYNGSTLHFGIPSD